MLTQGESGRTVRFSHMLARLIELQNYVWDPEIEPFHSVGVPEPHTRVER